MWRVSAAWAVASAALLAGLAGGAGAHPVAIAPPANKIGRVAVG
jgi:hypothetical protein